MQPNVFVLDTDIEQCQAMVDSLHLNGFEVVDEVDSLTALSRVTQVNPGIILMSEDMPNVNGVRLLPLLRRRMSTPIIVFGNGVETAVVAALLQGADMYVARPLNLDELVSRVRALIRRTHFGIIQSSSENVPLPISEILPAEIVSLLTDTESRLFSCLAEKHGKVVGHEELMLKVWGKTVKRERLRFYIHSLRRKLNESVSLSLQTRNGVGYLLDNPAIQS